MPSLIDNGRFFTPVVTSTTTAHATTDTAGTTSTSTSTVTSTMTPVGFISSTNPAADAALLQRVVPRASQLLAELQRLELEAAIHREAIDHRLACLKQLRIDEIRLILTQMYREARLFKLS